MSQVTLQALVAAIVGQAIGYFALAGGLALLVRRWGRARLAPARIPQTDRLDRAQVIHEVRATLATLVIGALGPMALQASGHVRVATTISAPAFLGWVLALLLLNDAWFYAAHRLLHTRWLYRHVHAVHHRSVDVNPLTSYSFHVVEAFLLTAWIYPMALLVPLPLPALGVAQVLGLANNLVAHLGYELLPRGWLRLPGLRWSTSATYHSLHHTRFHGNYGLMTRTWDRLFRTELPQYEATFLARGASGPTDAG